MLARSAGRFRRRRSPAPIFAETEGNPFFVEEVFRHLAEEGKLFGEGGRWIPDLRVGRLEVPEGVRLVIGKRLKRLSERVATSPDDGSGDRPRGSAWVCWRRWNRRDADAALDAVEEAERAQLVTAEGGRP